MSTVMNTVKRNSDPTKGFDFFETQDITIDYLYNNYLKYRDDFKESLVTDFCCGKGAILKRLKELDDSITVYGCDIINRSNNNIGNMFDIEVLLQTMVVKDYKIHVVMNPPFNKLDEVLDYYLDLFNRYDNIKSISLLHSLRSLETTTRYEILEKHNRFPNIILNMVSRQNFNTYFEGVKGEWKPPFSCVWSIWDRESNREQTIMKYIKKVKKVK